MWNVHWNKVSLLFPCDSARGLAVFWEHIIRMVPPIPFYQSTTRLTNFYILTCAGQKGIKTTGLKGILLSVMLKYHFSTQKVMFSNLEIWGISKVDCPSFPGYNSASQACSPEALCTLQGQRTLCPTGSGTGRDSSRGAHEVQNTVGFDCRIVTVVLQSCTWKTAILS